MARDRLATAEQVAFLYQTFAELQSSVQIEALMADLCTIREINEMATRLQVARMLASGQSYLEIQNHTGSSATTIARVSKCLTHGSGGYRALLGQRPATNPTVGRDDHVTSQPEPSGSSSDGRSTRPADSVNS